MLSQEIIDNRIKRTVGNFAVDGLILDGEDINRLERCLRGDISFESAIEEIKEQYKENYGTKEPVLLSQ